MININEIHLVGSLHLGTQVFVMAGFAAGETVTPQKLGSVGSLRKTPGGSGP